MRCVICGKEDAPCRCDDSGDLCVECYREFFIPNPTRDLAEKLPAEALTELLSFQMEWAEVW
jgi:hypothetical protein